MDITIIETPPVTPAGTLVLNDVVVTPTYSDANSITTIDTDQLPSDVPTLPTWDHSNQYGGR